MPKLEDVTCSSLCIEPSEAHHNHFFFNFNGLIFSLLFFCSMQIGASDLVQEATPVIDEQLLKEVNLAAKLSNAKASLHGG